MADRIDPNVPIAAWSCHNGNVARFTDPRLADLMQAYMIAGEPFGWPPWVTGIDCQDESIEYNLYIPVVIRPGQSGWIWGAKMMQQDVSVDANGEYNHPPYIQAECYETDLATPLHVFTSQIAGDSVYTNGSAGSWATMMLTAPWVWSGSGTYTVPPVTPSPGALQVAPSKSHRDAVVVLVCKNIIAATITAQPVISGALVSAMS